MEEFKKWKTKYLQEANKKHEFCNPYIHIKEETVWKAALEWVLRMFLRGDSFESIAVKIKTELGIK